jgi:hypothetical protein
VIDLHFTTNYRLQSIARSKQHDIRDKATRATNTQLRKPKTSVNMNIYARPSLHLAISSSNSCGLVTRHVSGGTTAGQPKRPMTSCTTTRHQTNHLKSSSISILDEAAADYEAL